MSGWDDRYATQEYLFGREPSRFVKEHEKLFVTGQSALAIADGEGRNGVWMAERGLDVHSIDISPNALRKAEALATERGVSVRFEQVDLDAWAWPKARYDIVAGIFIQFADPSFRARMFAGMKAAVKPGGLVLLHGYTPKQLEYRTGGPSEIANLYTEDLLREAFSDFEILELHAYEAELAEGRRHHGRSALIDLVARRPAA